MNVQEPIDAPLQPGGVLGERQEACTAQWLLCAPDANPAMLALLRDRDRQPRRELVPWAGEFAGKYLTSLTECYRLTGDARLRWQLDRFVPALLACQADDGYFGPAPRDQRLTGTTAAGHGLWDVWGHYHVLLGLLMWHEITGDAEVLAACGRCIRYICSVFLDGDKRAWDAGSHEMNQALCHVLPRLAELLGEPRCLALARQILDDFERPPAGDYIRSALAGVPFWQCPKPRWESLHPIQGILAMYHQTGDERLRGAFEALWWSMLEGDRHNHGGFTAGEQAVGNPYHPGAVETCCTVAWSALSVDMLQLTGNPLVADELELSLYNGLLGGQVPSGRWWTYNTPSDGVKRASAHDIVFQAREGSPELNCCSVNGPRGLGLVNAWGLTRGEAGLFVNAWGPSSCTLEAGGTTVRLSQHTRYPVGLTVDLRVSCGEPVELALNLRIPSWSERTTVRIDGLTAEPRPGSYLRLERRWRDGDTVRLRFDERPHVWIGDREAVGQVSVYRGPLLLAFDPRFAGVDPPPRPLTWPLAAPLAVREHRDDGGPRPWLLVDAPFAGGEVTLCDFASAGWTGTPYRSWLPAEGLPQPAAFSRETPVWARRS